LKVASFFSGSVLLGAAILAGSLIITPRPLLAVTLISTIQQEIIKQPQPLTSETDDSAKPSGGSIGEAIATPIAEQEVAVAAAPYVATAYSLRGRTASGRPVNKGIIAADPRFLPLGSRVRLEAGAYSGEYLVADTGGSVRGRRIDIWTPTAREAMRFGRRKIKLIVLSFGGKRKATPTSTKK
jgi:3D (Asp-Asp-Asp) domain-containing protein